LIDYGRQADNACRSFSGVIFVLAALIPQFFHHQYNCGDARCIQTIVTFRRFIQLRLTASIC
jgi:hypothetical protein